MGQFNLLHDKRVMIIVEKGGGEIISDCKRKILAVNRRLYPPSKISYKVAYRSYPYRKAEFRVDTR